MARSKTPGVVHIPWYATGFRGDAFAEALAEFAPIAMRYGALDYQVFRSREDRYRFLQIATFETKLDWERFWEGDEAVAFRLPHERVGGIEVVGACRLGGKAFERLGDTLKQRFQFRGVVNHRAAVSV